MEILLAPALLAHLCEAAPGIHLRLHNIDPSQLLDDLDADRLDLAIGYGVFAQGQAHHKRRLLYTGTYLCLFNAERVGVSPPISLEDYVRLPHVLTSLREGERGVVDDALAKLGLRRTVVLTTPRFLAVPFLVARAPVVVTMPARLARLFARSTGAQHQPGAGGAAGGAGLAALARLLRRGPGACVAASDHRPPHGGGGAGTQSGVTPTAPQGDLLKRLWGQCRA